MLDKSSVGITFSTVGSLRQGQSRHVPEKVNESMWDYLSSVINVGFAHIINKHFTKGRQMRCLPNETAL